MATLPSSVLIFWHRKLQVPMPYPMKERIVKLRDEIAQISEANRLHKQGDKNMLGVC
jgi:hypothetical protein